MDGAARAGTGGHASSKTSEDREHARLIRLNDNGFRAFKEWFEYHAELTCMGLTASQCWKQLVQLDVPVMFVTHRAPLLNLVTDFKAKTRAYLHAHEYELCMQFVWRREFWYCVAYDPVLRPPIIVARELRLDYERAEWLNSEIDDYSSGDDLLEDAYALAPHPTRDADTLEAASEDAVSAKSDDVSEDFESVDNDETDCTHTFNGTSHKIDADDTVTNDDSTNIVSKTELVSISPTCESIELYTSSNTINTQEHTQTASIKVRSNTPASTANVNVVDTVSIPSHALPSSDSISTTLPPIEADEIANQFVFASPEFAAEPTGNQVSIVIESQPTLPSLSSNESANESLLNGGIYVDERSTSSSEFFTHFGTHSAHTSAASTPSFASRTRINTRSSARLRADLSTAKYANDLLEMSDEELESAPSKMHRGKTSASSATHNRSSDSSVSLSMHESLFRFAADMHDTDVRVTRRKSKTSVKSKAKGRNKPKAYRARRARSNTDDTAVLLSDSDELSDADEFATKRSPAKATSRRSARTAYTADLDFADEPIERLSSQQEQRLREKFEYNKRFSKSSAKASLESLTDSSYHELRRQHTNCTRAEHEAQLALLAEEHRVNQEAITAAAQGQLPRDCKAWTIELLTVYFERKARIPATVTSELDELDTVPTEQRWYALEPELKRLEGYDLVQMPDTANVDEDTYDVILGCVFADCPTQEFWLPEVLLFANPNYRKLIVSTRSAWKCMHGESVPDLPLIDYVHTLYPHIFATELPIKAADA